MTLFKKITLLILGSFFVFLGALGVVLPFVHGAVFLLVGIVLLSFEIPYVERKLRHYAEKNKLLLKWHKKVDALLRRWFNK
jgi:uncharacterized membrane protein YbaN (DUF454 family)